MGYGKTTAVRKFLEIKKIKPVWITFQPENGAADYKWNKVCEEIGKWDQNTGQTLKQLGFPVDVPQMDQVLSVLSQMTIEESLFMVLDDYHLTAHQPLDRLIELIVSERIDNFHLVIITRSSGNLNASELVAKGFCRMISQEILKFTEVEVRDYCTMMMATISEQDLQKVNQYASGWITLTYMLLLGLEKGIAVGMNMAIDDLISLTLFDVYDQPTRDFLIKLSIMDTFTAEQAQFITGVAETAEILKKLNKENSFIYYDEVNHSYLIHAVLLDFLRSKQNLLATEKQDLYCRLGEWYLDKMNFPKAYTCFYRGGDVLRVLEHLNNPENIRNELAEFEGSQEMFEKTPIDQLRQYPIAYLQAILIALIRGNEQTAIGCRRQLDQLERFYNHQEGLEQTYRNRILAEINILKKFTVFNHIEESTAANDLILSLLKGEQSYILQRENEFTFGSPHLTYNYYREPGLYQKTTQLIIDKFPIYPQYTNGCGTGSEYLARAEYSLETGNWAEAQVNGEKAIYKARTKDQYSIIIGANFVLMRLMILQGRIGDALERLGALEAEIEAVRNPIFNTTIDICKGYIYANLQQPEKIPYWLQVGHMNTAELFYQGVAFNYLVYGKAVTASRNYLKLEILAESFVEYFAIYHNQLGFIHNGIFNAIAKYHLNGLEAGILALNKTLSEAHLDGIILPFVENAPDLIEMVREICKRQPKDAFIKKLLSVSEVYLQNLKNGELSRISLTQREQEVLRLTAAGLKREAIAKRLYIAPATVKTHLQNVYKKLAVNGKNAAIKTAVKNGLLLVENEEHMQGL
ncbi:MAG: LuxR family transcriptional regulator [Acetobacterium sp.]|nr:LuxR family transcriptional regulator [Acetobacterium sp.]